MTSYYRTLLLSAYSESGLRDIRLCREKWGATPNNTYKPLCASLLYPLRAELQSKQILKRSFLLCMYHNLISVLIIDNVLYFI